MACISVLVSISSFASLGLTEFDPASGAYMRVSLRVETGAAG